MDTNRLYFGDNLRVLRDKIPTESVDLIYLDPPFNSNRNYFVLFKDRTGKASAAQEAAFEDTWTWNSESEVQYKELVVSCPNHELSTLIQALRTVLHESPMMAYIVAMAIRLIEMHRVLKPTGSLYLHCDPTASHYLKIVLDVIFEPTNFRSEVIWKRTSAHSSARRFGPVHDTILFYTKSESFIWNQTYAEYDQHYLDEFYTHVDKDGRRWQRSDLTGAGTRNGETGLEWRGLDITAKGRHWAYPPSVLEQMDLEGKIHWPTKPGGMPRLIRYADEQKGVPQQDVWTDISPMHNLSAERLGYPTQKPLSLLRRILETSSNPDDIVLDPFCGCGTTVCAAHELNRKWIGIDVTAVAIAVIKSRLESTFADLKGKVIVDGFPRDFESARQLFELDPHRFQIWACTLIDAYPLQKKGADSGIDGWLNFVDWDDKPHRGVVQVKGGKVQVGLVRDFCHVVKRENAALGFFICMGDVTKPMREEALKEGFWTSASRRDYPKIQILSVADLLAGTDAAKLPPQDKASILGFKAQGRDRQGQQAGLGLFDNGE